MTAPVMDVVISTRIVTVCIYHTVTVRRSLVTGVTLYTLKVVAVIIVVVVVMASRVELLTLVLVIISPTLVQRSCTFEGRGIYTRRYWPRSTLGFMKRQNWC
jgi:hypothetical protein